MSTTIGLAIDWIGPYIGPVLRSLAFIAVGALIMRVGREKTPEEIKIAMSKSKIDARKWKTKANELQVANEALKARLAWYRGHAQVLADGPGDGAEREIRRAG